MKIKLFLAAMPLFLISCGDRNAEQAKTGEAQDIKKSTGSEYSINLSDSEVHWRGTKPGGEHYGTVDIESGKVITGDGELTGGTITIDLATIVTNDLSGNMAERLVGHLKSEDFFHVEEHPKAVFEIAEAKKIEAEEGQMANYTITGNLTMRGETKSISFPAWVEISDGKVHAKTEEFSIDRTLWGVNFKSKSVFAEFKDDYISDMINLKFDAVFSE